VEGETEEKDTDVELLDDAEGNGDDGVETPEPKKEEVAVSSPQINENGKEEVSAVTTENHQDILQEDSVSLEGSVSESEARSETRSESSDDLKPISSSRSSSFDSKRHQISETVSNVISNALLSTTQTLATVGATAKEIHTMATAIVRTNFHHGHTSPKDTWQPPRAWVPKGTQTTWTPSDNEDVKGAENTDAGYNPYIRQLTQLTEMGFCDMEKNERLLKMNNGNLDRVILILLDEKIGIPDSV